MRRLSQPGACFALQHRPCCMRVRSVCCVHYITRTTISTRYLLFNGSIPKAIHLVVYRIYRIIIFIIPIIFSKDQAILKYVCTSLRELRDTADPHNIDPEAYFRLVLLARGVAVARPNHLVKYTTPPPPRPPNGKTFEDFIYERLKV